VGIDRAAARHRGAGPLVEHRRSEELTGPGALRVQGARVVMGIADVGTHVAPAGGLAAPAAAFAGLRGQGRAEESGQEAQGEADGGAADRDVS
jgi:hypothetical protein